VASSLLTTLVEKLPSVIRAGIMGAGTLHWPKIGGGKRENFGGAGKNVNQDNVSLVDVCAGNRCRPRHRSGEYKGGRSLITRGRVRPRACSVLPSEAHAHGARVSTWARTATGLLLSRDSDFAWSGGGRLRDGGGGGVSHPGFANGK